MSELKPCPCPICGAELKIYGPEDWHPTFYDPDCGGDPYNAVCDCGFSFSTGTYDYAEFVAALNRRAQPENKPADAVPVVRCGECKYYEPHIDYLTGKLYRFGECEKIGERDQEGGACFNRNTDDDDFCSYGKRKENT